MFVDTCQTLCKCIICILRCESEIKLYKKELVTTMSPLLQAGSTIIPIVLKVKINPGIFTITSTALSDNTMHNILLRVLVFEFLSSLDSLELSLHAPDDSGDINRPLQSKNDMAWMAPFNLNIVPEM